jgi:ribonucleotide reductase alpha subunit
MEKNQEQVRQETLKFFKGDELATDVFLKKYSKNGEETPKDLWFRLANEFTKIEQKYGKIPSDNDIKNLSEYGKKRALTNYWDWEENIYNLLKDFNHIIPGGSFLSGAGTGQPVSLSNCFTIKSPDDNIDSLFNTARDQSQIFKRRGGCIEENSHVIIKGKGVIPIKDVSIMDEILSFNINTKQDEWKIIKDKYYTNVEQNEQIEIIYKNGVRLKTSENHPLLTLNEDNYYYDSVKNNLKEGDVGKSPSIISDLDNIGYHVGSTSDLNDDFFLTKEEQEKITNFSVKKLKKCRKAFLLALKNLDVLSNDNINEILSRTYIKEIIYDNVEKYNYIDIEVEDNNNYYAGTLFGFVNIHNCGFDLSNIRPKGAIVHNAAIKSDGVIPWMELYSKSTEIIAQAGRRGAGILTLDCKHPDLLDFITVKEDLNKIQGANISVKWDNNFMNAMENDEDYILRFPIDHIPDIAKETLDEMKYNEIV